MKRAGILFVLAGLAGCPAPAAASDCQVTMAQYEQLRIGMSEAQVVAILGCDGWGIERDDGMLVLLWDGTPTGGLATVFQPPDGKLVWDATPPGAGLGAVFQNGKLVEKVQSGLK